MFVGQDVIRGEGFQAKDSDNKTASPDLAAHPGCCLPRAKLDGQLVFCYGYRFQWLDKNLFLAGNCCFGHGLVLGIGCGARLLVLQKHGPAPEVIRKIPHFAASHAKKPKTKRRIEE